MLLATFIGGTGFFFGPILGAVVFIFFVVALSGFTQAWLLYLGLFFLAHGDVRAGRHRQLIMMQLPVIRAGRFGKLVVPYLLALAAGLVAFAGLVGVVEMVYRISDANLDTQMALFGIGFDAKAARPWIAFSLLLAAGLAALVFAARHVGERWGGDPEPDPGHPAHDTRDRTARSAQVLRQDRDHPRRRRSRSARASVTRSSARTAPASRPCST